MSDFVDVVQLNVKGGDGGAGCVSFRREAHVPRGGPDGGNGGNGGDVVLRADRNTASLLAFRDYPHRRASSGTHGSGKKRNGGRGEDLVIDVPVGTVVRHREGDLIADLANDGDNVVVARGGQGGAGNARFLSNRRRAPEFAEQGEYGEEFWLVLELRLLADVALVGMPNAGKSTFIASVSAAKPKIASASAIQIWPRPGCRKAALTFLRASSCEPGVGSGWLMREGDVDGSRLRWKRSGYRARLRPLLTTEHRPLACRRRRR